jgi:hypothetical protein
MNAAQTIPTQKPVVSPAKTPDAARYFYSISAIVLFALMAIGFQQFYLHGKAYPNRPLAPPTRVAVISHGIAMSAWMVLFVVQPLLVATNNRKLHITLGKIGAVLSALIVILGMNIAIQSGKFTPPEAKIWGLPGKNFMAVPVISILLFAVFVAIGVIARKKPAIHRPMMFMAVMATMAAAVSRIDYLDSLYHMTIWERVFGPFFMTLVIGFVLFVIKTALTRSFDRYYALGFVALVAVNWFTWTIAPTDAWLSVANVLTK